MEEKPLGYSAGQVLAQAADTLRLALALGTRVPDEDPINMRGPTPFGLSTFHSLLSK